MRGVGVPGEERWYPAKSIAVFWFVRLDLQMLGMRNEFTGDERSSLEMREKIKSMKE